MIASVRTRQPVDFVVLSGLGCLAVSLIVVGFQLFAVRRGWAITTGIVMVIGLVLLVRGAVDFAEYGAIADVGLIALGILVTAVAALLDVGLASLAGIVSADAVAGVALGTAAFVGLGFVGVRDPVPASILYSLGWVWFGVRIWPATGSTT